ncbi:MAG: RNA polymerase sigma factor [Acidimicrobiales bacterium]
MASRGQAEGLKAGEEEFRPFYDAHFGAVYRYFARRVHSAADVNDLVADVFLVAWRRFDELPASSHEKTLWLYGVARRVLADSRKAERRRYRLLGRIGAMSEPPQVASADFANSSEPAAARLSSAISQLTARDREVLTLVAWEQLSHGEAAEVLGCSVNAFTIRLHRARKRLAARYSALGGEPAPLKQIDAPTRPQGAPDGRP